MKMNLKKKKATKIAKREYMNKSAYAFIFPYWALFIVFIVIPICIAMLLSFTNFNSIEWPDFVAFDNYITLITKDTIFMQYVLPKTILFSVIVGPGGYVLSFLLAWALSRLHRIPRTICALILYSPTLTSGQAMNVLWKILFGGDQTGYVNSWLMSLGIINEPIVWFTNATYLLPIVIGVGLWSSMGVGFLAILSAILNADEALYEAAAIDGVKNSFQEMIYITIPTMKPQMLFAAVMAIVGAFKNGVISSALAGNPTPGYAAQLMVNHIEDYGFLRYEMGYAAAVSVVLLLIIYAFSGISNKLFKED